VSEPQALRGLLHYSGAAARLVSVRHRHPGLVTLAIRRKCARRDSSHSSKALRRNAIRWGAVFRRATTCRGVSHHGGAALLSQSLGRNLLGGRRLMWRVRQAGLAIRPGLGAAARVQSTPVAIHRVRRTLTGEALYRGTLRDGRYAGRIREYHARIELAARLQHVTDGRACGSPPGSIPLGRSASITWKFSNPETHPVSVVVTPFHLWRRLGVWNLPTVQHLQIAPGVTPALTWVPRDRAHRSISARLGKSRSQR